MPVVNKPPVLISSGSLDTSFGGDGLTSTAIGVAHDQARGIAIQSNGKYVVAGWSDTGGGNYDFAVVRFNVDGSPDTSFSGDGKQTTGIAGADQAYGVAIQSDGKIVVAGATNVGASGDFAIVRYDTNGALDTGFSGDGIQTTSLSSFDDAAAAVAIQSDGRILAAGTSGSNFAIVRYDVAGALDATFDADGKFTGSFGSSTSVANAMALQADGKIIVAGYGWSGSSWDFGVARLSTAGALDNSFSGDGKVLISIDPGSSSVEEFKAVAIQSDAKVLLAGRTTGSGVGDTYDAVLVRLDANGNPDAGFGGGDGIVTLDLSNWDELNSVVLQADGKIVAAGSVQTGVGEALIARFNTDGTLDTSFSGDGVFSTPFGSGTSAIYGLAMAPSGQVVAAGDSFTGTYDIGMLRLASAVTDQSAISGSAFSYSVPAGAFFDADGNPLTYAATLANGAPLPAWLSFNAATRTFSGTPADGDFGTRQVKVTASDGSASISATFQLEVSTDFIEALRDTDHARWNDASPNGTPGTSLTFSFMDVAPSYGTATETGTFAPMTVAEEQAVRDVLQLYHEIAGITFNEVADAGAGGQLRFGTYNSAAGTESAYAYGPSSAQLGGDVWVNRFYPGYATPVAGDFSFETLIHEIGHALGLKHPFDDGSSNPPFLATGVENTQYTVMSYNHRTDALYRDVTGTTAGDIHFFDVYDSTQMLYDVAAIQFIYGANTSASSGNDTYTFLPATPFFKTLWDSGGIDTISVSNFTEACVIDLRDGHYSSIRILSDPLPPGFSGGTQPTYDGTNNLAIAFGSIIENATGGGGNDTLIGNAANNRLDGGAGADTLIGGAGDDTYLVANFGDVVTEAAAAGTDMVQASVTSTLSLNVENLALTGAGAINGTGNTLANTITGNAGNNVLDGGAGVDTASYSSAALAVVANLTTGAVTGGAGNDTLLNFENLTGSNFNDTLTGNPGANLITGGLGNDTIDGALGVDTASYSSATLAVVANLATGAVTGGAGNDTLLSIENLTGSNLNDTLTGNAGANVFNGGLGNDTIDGAAGADTMAGGSGNDTFVVDSTLDVVTEAAAAGTDLVQSTALAYTLAANVENLTLLGVAAINGTGNTSINVLTGNSGNNVLNGGLGNDTMIGGLGNDTYVVDSTLDVVTEAAAAGTDLVQSTALAYTLAANVENLTLLGVAAINGTGNTSINVLTGNSANNVLNGGLGNDTMIGGLGNDTYVVDSTLDVVTEAAAAGTDLVQSTALAYTLALNVENLTLLGVAAINGTGNTSINVLTGNSSNNVLNGGLGNDTMIGGLGNDTYVVDSTLDVVTEAAAAGTDLVQSSVTYTLTLAANVENLTLLGVAAINGTGNTSINVLTGNSGNNVLNGGVGNDTMIGGLGNDTYVVDSTLDVVTEAAAAGTDLVQSTALAYTLSTNVENLTLLGVAAINGTGNTSINVLTGNSGNNVLNGGIGNDTMIGGLGNDTYVVDSTLDVVTEAAAAGTDLVQSTALAYTLSTNVENLTLLGVAAINGTGNTSINVLTGNSGNNVLNGGVGNDTMIGGLGNDTYVVDSTLDVVTEAAAAGTDLVQSTALAYTLALNVENLTLLGVAAINGTGNTLANVLTGNSGNNVLNGGLGNDTMIGGLGNDTYVVDSTLDVVTEAAAAGTDLVQSTALAYTLALNVENLTLLGVAAINGTGNTLANTITGNAAANVLNGGAGADSLTGGAGADRFVFDSKVGTDSVTDFLSGTDKFGFSQAGIGIGNGNTVIDAAVTVAGPGGFAAASELVIVTGNILGAITAASAALAIGSAASAYGAGNTRLFSVDNGTASGLFLFTSSAGDAAVSAAELTLVGMATSTPGTLPGDYQFVA